MPNQGSGDVSVIDSSTNTVVDTISFGPNARPVDIAYNPTNKDMYVTDDGLGDVSVIDSSTNTVIGTIGIGSYTGPYGIAFNPTNNDMYVVNRNSNTVSVISTSLTPTQGIQNLINTIDSFHLPKGVTTNLEAPLNAALAQLNHNNPTPACNQMTAFLNQVNAKQTNGQLTLQQAADLSQQAKAIQQAIGCSNIGGMLGQTSPSLLALPMP